jgi:hypothetical protein
LGPDPLGGVDHAALERRVDLAGRREDRCATGPGQDLAPHPGDAHLEALDDLAGRIDLDAEPPAAHLVDDLAQPDGGALHDVELLGPGGGEPPLDLRLGDDVRGAGQRHRGRGRGAAGLGEKRASLEHHAASSVGRWCIPPPISGGRLRSPAIVPRTGRRGPAVRSRAA